jgi:tetratricopeptide (TPR) repeat protein
MELTLTRKTGMQVLVTCDDRTSHTFDLRILMSGNNDLSYLPDDPIAYGKALYQALFPQETVAWSALNANLERIMIVATDDIIDAIPWEYIYGPDGFLVLECRFVRGLPADQRIAPPTLDTGLHIIAVPSNPLSQAVEPLDIEGEWMRLKDIIRQVPYTVTLERTRPPTMEQVYTQVASQGYCVIHFMGHGGQDEQGAFLCFEKDNGDLDPVTARQFILRIRDTVFLVTLNACISAMPGATGFSNLAASLVRQKTPYTLGMRFSISDEDARVFSRIFYSDLARGSSVEEALLQARLTLANSSRPWTVGVPVLYTALTKPSAGFASIEGRPTLKEHQPPIEVSALPRAEGAFQGRIDKLKMLGSALTGDSRSPLITIHGTGGQGKTALAREAAERFAWAWSGGVWATTLENLPAREVFVNDLARFLGIPKQELHDPIELEREVLRHLNQRRTLIVLDNVETLVEAVESNNEEAIRLVQFLREQLPRPPVSLIATSRSFLGWAGEIGCELTGLAPKEGIRLLLQHAPRRAKEIDQVIAWELSEQVDGHPLSLRLLSGAFNTSSISFAAFVKEYEAQFLAAENKYVSVDHRHRTLYTSIETSVRYLDDGLVDLFSRLWLFHAPFLPELAVEIFDPTHDDTKNEDSPVYGKLYTLWRRGLLAGEERTYREGAIRLYRVLATIRPYIEHYLARAKEREYLLARLGTAYAGLARNLYHILDQGGVGAFIALQAREDLERGMSYVKGVELGYYLLHWGWILQRLIDTRRGLKLIEQALEIGQGQDRQLESQALNSMGGINRKTGHPKRALELYEQALPLMREVGNRDGEAATLNNIAEVQRGTGELQQALELYEQALPLMREVGNREGEAATLNNMSLVYDAMGQWQQALELYEQVLPITREEGNRALEARTLNNTAEVYRKLGQWQQAMKLYEQTVPITREVGDRVMEAITLDNIAKVYYAMGQWQRALELYERALLLKREVGDRSGEAETLSNIGEVYRATGEHKRALKLFEQALLFARAVGGRAVEVTILSNIGEVYRAAGEHKRALEVYEQALPFWRSIGGRAGEATTLNNIGMVYQTMGQPPRALELYEQALPLWHDIGDRVGEATTLNNMAMVYQVAGEHKRALEVYEQALPLWHDIGDRVREAPTLTNMAEMYRAAGRPKRALELYEQALPLWRVVGDQAREAATLYSLANLLMDTQHYEEALASFNQSVQLEHAVNHVAGEVAGLVGVALLLYQHLNRPQEAITKMEQAFDLFKTTGLPQSAAGQTVDDLQRYVDSMRQGLMLEQASSDRATMPYDQLQTIVSNTVVVMTTMPERRAEWREVVVKGLQNAQQHGTDLHNEVEFITALLAILDGKAVVLPNDHPLSFVLAEIQEGIEVGGQEDDQNPQDDDLPFDAELIPRSIAALLGRPQEKMAHVQYLTAMSAQTADEGLKALLEVIQLGLFGSDLSQLGQNLNGVYLQTWETIVVGVETGGVDPRLFEMIVQTTLAVLGPVAEKRSEWHKALMQIRSQAIEGDVQDLVALVDAVIGLLDAEGNPAGLGMSLNGVYARTWQAIVESLA